MKEHILSSSFYQKGIFYQFVDSHGLAETFYAFSVKLLPTCWICKSGFYFCSLHKINISKQR